MHKVTQTGTNFESLLAWIQQKVAETVKFGHETVIWAAGMCVSRFVIASEDWMLDGWKATGFMYWVNWHSLISLCTCHMAFFRWFWSKPSRMSTRRWHVAKRHHCCYIILGLGWLGHLESTSWSNCANIAQSASYLKKLALIRLVDGAKIVAFCANWGLGVHKKLHIILEESREYILI